MTRPDPSSLLRVGVARREIGPFPTDIGMMGWGMLHNVVHGARTPLHARAFVCKRGDEAVALVCCELAFISLAVKAEVCTRLANAHPELGLHERNLMLMATHTHSGPGGFTHYPFYNITIPGFVPAVVERIADAVVGALVDAHAGLRPGTVRYAESEVPLDVPVAWNRSVPSYNSNAEVAPVSEDEPERALDRTMRLFRFDDAEGNCLGAIDWFAVHCTSVHSDNTDIHFDNKGYAAQMLEDDRRAAGEPGFVGAFAQGAAGDVTPNFRRYREKPWTRGAHLDDDESARDNGRLQMRHAAGLLAEAGAAPAVQARLRHAHAFVDFSDVEVDPRYSDGRPGRRTGPAEIGWAMLFGTEEGPGLPRSLRFTQALVQRARPLLARLGGRRGLERHAEREAVQGPKVTALETGRRRFLGLRRLRRLPIPWRLHPSLRLVGRLDETDRDDPRPWTPQVLPVQLICIGEVAIAAVPAEFTTVAGLRLRASVARALASVGVEHVVLAGYANAYAGYVTTAEEYARQDYEGASTHFGTWTLAAYQTSFDAIAREIADPAGVPARADGPRPPTFTSRDLEGRVWPGA
jgi:neutral ceramidase